MITFIRHLPCTKICNFNQYTLLLRANAVSDDGLRTSQRLNIDGSFVERARQYSKALLSMKKFVNYKPSGAQQKVVRLEPPAKFYFSKDKVGGKRGPAA